MELDDLTSVFAKVPFFEICELEQQRLLAFASEPRKFRAGDIVFSQGGVSDGAYVITRGSVAITDDSQRGNKPFGISGPNVLVGELALVLDRPRRKTVTAVTDLETVFVPRAAFNKLLRQFPELAERARERLQSELSDYLGALDRFRHHAGDAGQDGFSG